MTSSNYQALINEARAPRSQRIALVLACLVAPAVLLAILLLLSREFERADASRHAVDRSYQSRAQLQTVLSTHQDIEIGQRGFVITGDERFLEPNILAVSRIKRELERLGASLADEPALRDQLMVLDSLSAAKLRFTGRTIAVRRQGHAADAQRMIARGTGRDLMDRIRRLISAIDATERSNLQQRLAQSDAASRAAKRLSTGLQLLLLALLAVALFLNARTNGAYRKALRAVHDLNARQTAILDGAKDGIIILNPSGGIESLNPAAAAMFGYQPAELVSRDVGVLFDVAPDRGKMESFLTRLERHAALSDRVQELQGRRHDGSSVVADVAVSAVPLAIGTRFVAIVRDISDRKQVEQMKDGFVSTVSHELRTPLTSIAGSLGLLAAGAGGVLPDRALRLIGIAKNNSERLVRLVNDILDIEKISAGQMPFDIRPIDLSGVLRLIIDANSGFAAQHGIELALNAPEQAIVAADPDRLQQVVTNLLSNAIKFSPAGGRVDLSLSAVDRQWRISVADRGPGIASEFEGRIFSRFAQADTTDTRDKGGTGLGLAIVKEIVDRLGGTVGWARRENGGTIFQVDLPALAPVTERPVACDSLPNLLHVDDDSDAVALVAEAFAGRASVRSAASLAAARTALRAGSPQLLILDRSLPDGCGLDLLAEIAPELPVIIFSAEDGPAPGVARTLVKSRASLDMLVTASLSLMRAVERKAAA